MNAKVREKEKALELRRRGYSYRDILREVPVAKSSLSLWLNELPLSEEERRVLKGRKDANITRGKIRAAASNRMRRIVRDGFLLRDSKREFEQHKHKPFFQLGIALYWAEGTKRSNSFGFTNADPDMIHLMLGWIREFLDPVESEIGLRLYIHRPFAGEVNESYWAEITGIPLRNFKKTVYKPGISLVKRRPGYKGCIRIELGKVKYLRKMQFWQNLLIEEYAKTR